MCQVQSHHGHDETLRSKNPVLTESKHETLEHFVGNCRPSLPEQRPEVVAAGFVAVGFIQLVEGDPPELQHVHEHRNVQNVNPSADVVVSQHDEAFAEVKTWFF